MEKSASLIEGSTSFYKIWKMFEGQNILMHSMKGKSFMSFSMESASGLRGPITCKI